MVRACNIREVTASGVIKGAREWGIAETTLPSETVKEIIEMGDEATFLNTLGFSPSEDTQRVQNLASFLESREAIQALRDEGKRWRVKNILASEVEILPKVANSLAMDSSPGRIGRLLRALPVIAGSRYNPIGLSLSRALKSEPTPETMILTYSKAFCLREEKILAAVDRIIVNDRVLGPLVLELTGRLLRILGLDGFNLDTKSREALIECLTLFVRHALEKGEASDTSN